MPSGNLPAYHCDMNLSADATGYFLIGTGVLGTDKIGGAYGVGQWTDLTSRLESFSITRGRQDELSGVQAGSISVRLHDDDGAFDPDYTSGTYYPNVKIMRQFRVSAVWAGTTYQLGYGFMDSLTAVPLPTQADVTLSGSDLFKRLSTQKRSVTLAQATVDKRLHAILDLIQWPPQQRAIDVSPYTVPAITLTATTAGQSLLAHIDSVVKADQGEFFIASDGTATYHDHYRRLTTASRATFGAGGLPARTVPASFRDTNIINQVWVKRTAGAQQTLNDTASQGNYDLRTYIVDQYAADCLMDDTQAAALGNWILQLRAQPVQRIDSIDLDGTGDDNLWPHILGADLGDRITITHDTPGTRGVVSQDYYIESIKHTWNPTSTPEHVCTWGLSKAQTLGSWLIIDGPGALGTGKVAY